MSKRDVSGRDISVPVVATAKSDSTRNLAASRSQAPHTSMFLRMLLRAAILRRGRATSALFAVVVAAAVATAMLTLFVDVQAKLHREFRNYGANIILVDRHGTPLPADTLARVESTLAGRGVAAPFAMVVARTGNGQPIVVAGTDFDRVRRLDHWWSVDNWPSAPQQALIGVRARSAILPGTAAATAATKNQPFDLSFQGHVIHLTPAGSVQTGAAEDSRIYLSLSDFVAWTGVQPSTIEVTANGSATEVASILNQLAQAIPAADVRPVRQIVEGEARVLGKTRATLLAAAVLIILTAALCMLSTLMGWVFDRRRDFAIMKALGASQRLLNGFFAAEAAALGATGAVIGFVVGIGIAAWIGRADFHAPVEPRFSVLPIVVAVSIAVTLLSAILPISLLRRVQPAVILRGE
ncbi:MAG: FtsX-like permease family protein [Candidatus Sulfotelmatobacter sp.]